MPEVRSVLKSLPELQLFELPGEISHVITHHRISGKVLVVVVENLSSTAEILLWQRLGLSQPIRWVKRGVIAAKLSTALDNKVFKLFCDAQPDCPKDK